MHTHFRAFSRNFFEKKFYHSLIWNWSVKTLPVLEKIFEKEQKNLPTGSGEQGILAFLLFEYQGKNF